MKYLDYIEIRKIIRDEIELSDLKKFRTELLNKKSKHLYAAEVTRSRYGNGSEAMEMMLYESTNKDLEKLDQKIFDMDVIARSTV